MFGWFKRKPKGPQEPRMIEVGRAKIHIDMYDDSSYDIVRSGTFYFWGDEVIVIPVREKVHAFLDHITKHKIVLVVDGETSAGYVMLRDVKSIKIEYVEHSVDVNKKASPA